MQAQLRLCGGNSGDPIFTENFGTGVTNNSLSPGTTTYTYYNGIPNNGGYTVSNNTVNNGLDWHELQEDHTLGDTNGKFLIVQADRIPGEFYQTRVSGLCETTTYEFSAWVINLVKANSFCSRNGGTIPINVRFEIWDSNNTFLIKAVDTGNIIETTSPIWQEYGLVFQTSAGQNSVILKMINNGNGGCGNDLAIDDIQFKSCGDTVVVTDSNNNTSVSLCSSQTPFNSMLTATPDGIVYNTHFYQWQQSTDGGFTWNDLSGETNQTLIISAFNTTYYRTKVAEVAINLTNPQCVSFSDEYQLTINQLPPKPTIDCWETATINNSTCNWDITGSEPIQPIIECWETATFNSTTCSWEVTGTQPTMPAGLDCWETASFNNLTCAWDVSGTQTTMPIIECWETATFNTITCSWEITGTQITQPIIACWEIATFNNATCVWDVTGTQPIQPNTECWETPTFNTITCSWEVTGTQPVKPATQCWETPTFNNSNCVWDVTGAQPVQPAVTNCWDNYQFNINTCAWENLGTQPGTVYSEDLVFCNGETPTLFANTSLSNPMYLWSTGETTESITVNTANVYTVEITTPACFFETRNFNVTQAPIPIIENVSSEGSNIVVTTSNNGDFLYSLNGNIYQPNNTFFNVTGGLYTIYVKERTCPDITTKVHLHFYIPKYFTPNNDGENDTFNLSGIEFYGESQVSIFNRYGKLIKFSQNAPFSWDGTFNNTPLSTDDFWYVIVIEGQKFTGHFTLKR